MKANPETCHAIKAAMLPLRDKVIQHAETLRNLPKYQNGEGNLAMRVRWDWFWAGANQSVRDSIPQLKEREFNDTHLDTVLRSICRDAGLPQFAD